MSIHLQPHGDKSDIYPHPVVIALNNFVYKSLSNFACNTAIGCSHACLFCSVPSTSTIKLKSKLAKYGVSNPDAEWGDYVLVRQWDEKLFVASLRAAENKPVSELKPDGNRAIIFCSTTDPYQTIIHADVVRQKELAEHNRFIVRRSLELIRDNSTLNVRILTRSPLARQDFDLFKSFGNRLVFGMSIPTLREDLARIYEPRTSRPSQRVATLKAAKDAGLHVYVAIAPSYPECDKNDLRATMTAVAELEPITIFQEPINIRADNVARIEAEAREWGAKLNTAVFATNESWRKYSLESLTTVESIAKELGVYDRLHLWPDKSLGSKVAAEGQPDPDAYLAWLHHWWNRISEWPKNRNDDLSPGSISIGLEHEDREKSSTNLELADQSTAIVNAPGWMSEVITAAQISDGRFEEPRWIVDGLLTESLIVVAGGEKAGKGLAVLDLATSIATGEKAFRWFDVTKGEVLILSMEDPSWRLKKRLDQRGGFKSEAVAFYFLSATGWPSLEAGGMDRLRDWMRFHPQTRLIVLDTLEKVFQTNRGYSRDYEVMGAVQKFAHDYHVAVVAVHHTTKRKSKDVFAEVRGSGIAKVADTIIVLERERFSSDGGQTFSGTFSVTGRDIGTARYNSILQFPIGTWVVAGHADGSCKSPERQRIKDILIRSNQPMKIAETLQALEKAGFKTTDNALRFLLAEMVKDGEIGRVGTGLYTAGVSPVGEAQ